MGIYKPSELFSFLESIGTAPKKGLSQNFLIDKNILSKIVDAAQVSPGDVVLEIGPGPGSLTEALLERGAHVYAVEKDALLAKALERFQTPGVHLQIFEEDILNFSLEKLPADKKIKVIANLPYHLTTPILARLVPHQELISKIVVMVQDEVARRMCAKPKTKEYSSFTVFLQFFTDLHYAFFVGRKCFYPSPKVDSAVVALSLKTPPNVSSQEAFFSLVRGAFGQRRKMLRASLKRFFAQDRLQEAFLAAKINETERPEALSLDDFLRLFQALEEQPGDP